MLFRPLILLIEDELPMRRVLRVALKNQGYDVQEAATGQEGLQRLASRMPNVVLLDLGLPDLDGVEVTTAIRKFEHDPRRGGAIDAMVQPLAHRYIVYNFANE